MEKFTVWPAIAFAVAWYFPSLGIKTVPNNMEFLVQRFGKYIRTLTPKDFHIVVPVIDQVSDKINTTEQVLRPTIQFVATKDNVDMTLVVAIYRRVVDSAKAGNEITNLDSSLQILVTGILRSTCGQMNYNQIQSSRDSINTKITTAVVQACTDWGIKIRTVEILDITVDPNIKLANQAAFVAEQNAKASNHEADAAAYAKETAAKAQASALIALEGAIKTNRPDVTDFVLRSEFLTQVAEVAATGKVKTISMPAIATVETDNLLDKKPEGGA